MNSDSRIFVAGHCGLVGSALVRMLTSQGYSNLLLKTRTELDLRDEAKVVHFFKSERPEFVFLAAGTVGGILANSTYPVEFFRDNVQIEMAVLEAAKQAKVAKLIFLGSSCIYPRLAAQPIREEELLSGPLEPTNEAYALAKIGGLKLCQAYNDEYGAHFYSVMPTNLYGQNDNFDPGSGHVIPSLIGRFHRAKLSNEPEVVVWGSGSPRREFMHVDDLAAGCIFAMQAFNGPGILNLGTGIDVSIAELVEKIRRVVGFEGRVISDITKPDGTPRKLLDVSRADRLGWRASISLDDGLQQTYAWYLQNHARQRTAGRLHVHQDSAANQR